MKAPKILIAGLVVLFALSTLAVAAQAPPQKAKEPAKKAPEKIFIPKEIKAVLQEGLATRQGRQDYPFQIFKDLLFPARENIHAVLFFKAKNADLGYGAPAAAPAPKAGQPAAPAAPAGVVEARFNVFIEFREPDTNGTSKILREVYIPANLQQDSATYDPAKEEWYSIGYTLVPGKYTVAMAIASLDLKKVGVVYYDITLPGPESYQSALDSTPPFIIAKMEQMQAPEMRTTIHRGYFTYSVLQIVPNIDNTVAPGDQIEVFYYVFGAKPKDQAGDQSKVDIEATYDIQKEDGKQALKWETQTYDFPLVSQPLPLKQTVIVKDDKGERTEQRDLAAGTYSLVIKIKDKVSGMTAEKKIPLIVK